MTQEQLNEILAKSPDDIVSELQKTSYTIPKWSDLEKQYNPKKHSIWDLTKYPPKKDEKGNDDFKRTALALQKLAVNRVAQSMFSDPVDRKYSAQDMNDNITNAIEMLEELYRIHNYIDSENIERAKSLNKSCQIATVWSVKEKETVIKGEKSKFKLVHNTYSEPEGYKLYPINDSYGELLVLSVGYTDSEKAEHMDVYVGGEKPAYLAIVKSAEGWIVDEELSNRDLGVFPVCYIHLPEPVWGGDDGTNLVEQLEEMESYQGLYIKRNSLPTFTLDYGEIEGKRRATNTEKSSDSRRIIKVGKGGSMKDVTWEGAKEAVDARYERIRNAFFEQIQVPDTSFANMIKSNTSAENKELIFADAKAKARDLGGKWEKFFLDEITIVLGFLKVILPKYAAQLENISVRSVISPYSIRTKKETAEYVSMAGGSMSLETKINLLDEADNVQDEIEKINSENSANANQLI